MLGIVVNEFDPTPVYVQIVNSVRHEIAVGSLKPGDSVPSVRELATYLGINVNTVNRAYQHLRSIGLVTIRPGRGAVISLDVERILGSSENKAKLEQEVRKLLLEARRLGFSPEEVTRMIAAAAKGLKLK